MNEQRVDEGHRRAFGALCAGEADHQTLHAVLHHARHLRRQASSLECGGDVGAEEIKKTIRRIATRRQRLMFFRRQVARRFVADRPGAQKVAQHLDERYASQRHAPRQIVVGRLGDEAARLARQAPGLDHDQAQQLARFPPSVVRSRVAERREDRQRCVSVISEFDGPLIDFGDGRRRPSLTRQSSQAACGSTCR